MPIASVSLDLPSSPAASNVSILRDRAHAQPEWVAGLNPYFGTLFKCTPHNVCLGFLGGGVEIRDILTLAPRGVVEDMTQASEGILSPPSPPHPLTPSPPHPLTPSPPHPLTPSPPHPLTPPTPSPPHPLLLALFANVLAAPHSSTLTMFGSNPPIPVSGAISPNGECFATLRYDATIRLSLMPMQARPIQRPGEVGISKERYSFVSLTSYPFTHSPTHPLTFTLGKQQIHWSSACCVGAIRGTSSYACYTTRLTTSYTLVCATVTSSASSQHKTCTPWMTC